jgi:hypothetical protein
MNLDQMTIGELKEIQILLGNNCKSEKHPYKIGQAYLIRTVTMIYTGRLLEVYPQELVIDEAAWIPETARWADTCKTGEVRECEPYQDGKVIIGRSAILDVCKWTHVLPRGQK